MSTPKWCYFNVLFCRTFLFLKNAFVIITNHLKLLKNNTVSHTFIHTCTSSSFKFISSCQTFIKTVQINVVARLHGCKTCCELSVITLYVNTKTHTLNEKQSPKQMILPKYPVVNIIVNCILRLAKIHGNILNYLNILNFFVSYPRRPQIYIHLFMEKLIYEYLILHSLQ